MADDTRLIRRLDRIAHALEALAKSNDPHFQTLAEKQQQAATEGPPSAKAKRANRRIRFRASV